MSQSVKAICWSDSGLKLLDQRLLPGEERYVECLSAAAVAEAISQMVVRGAPAIGIAAAYGLAIEANNGGSLSAALALLAKSRPTAVNLQWALDRMSPLCAGENTAEKLLLEAQRIHDEDVRQNLAMAEWGADLLPDGATVITHCNTGALATGGHGTALGVIRTGWQQSKIGKVYNTETRPWLQGSRLTSWELIREGIPSKLIADSAASHLMRSTKVDWVIVGADRIAANGDTANKIGTYSLAVAARAHGVKFMVVAPVATFDLDCSSGEQIPIEFRDGGELVDWAWSNDKKNAPDCWNPVFDVTPANLIDAMVCEKGVILNPDKDQILQLASA